jgi:hypothetical protein
MTPFAETNGSYPYIDNIQIYRWQRDSDQEFQQVSIGRLLVEPALTLGGAV